MQPNELFNIYFISFCTTKIVISRIIKKNRSIVNLIWSHSKKEKIIKKLKQASYN